MKWPPPTRLDPGHFWWYGGLTCKIIDHKTRGIPLLKWSSPTRLDPGHFWWYGGLASKPMPILSWVMAGCPRSNLHHRNSERLVHLLVYKMVR